ncbi:hypothetical protein Hdeb2414_s0001g00010351 [Helianthus debilis subsp. tardiflorus]
MRNFGLNSRKFSPTLVFHIFLLECKLTMFNTSSPFRLTPVVLPASWWYDSSLELLLVVFQVEMLSKVNYKNYVNLTG